MPMNPQFAAMLQNPQIGPFLWQMLMAQGQQQRQQRDPRVPGGMAQQPINWQMLLFLKAMRDAKNAQAAAQQYNTQQPTYSDPTQTPGYTPSPNPISSYPPGSGPFVPPGSGPFVPVLPQLQPGQGPTMPPTTMIPPQQTGMVFDPNVVAAWSPFANLMPFMMG